MAEDAVEEGAADVPVVGRRVDAWGLVHEQQVVVLIQHLQRLVQGLYIGVMQS